MNVNTHAKINHPSSSSSRQVPLTCHGHTRPVVSVQFSAIAADGNYYMISASKDGNPMLRDGPTGDWIGTYTGHKGAVWSARLNKDASRAVTGSADYTAKFWDAYSGDELYSFAHNHIVRATTLSADGTWMVTGGHEKIIRLYDLARPEADPFTIQGHTGNIKSVVWDAKRNVLLSAGEDKEIRVWDLRTQVQVRSCKIDAPIASMDITADEAFITCTSGKTAQFWNADTYEISKSYTMGYEVSSVSLHPNRSRFVAGGANDLWARIYDFETGNEMELYKGHHGPIHAVSYSPDGEIYATGSEDGTIRLWQTVPGTVYGLWAEKTVQKSEGEKENEPSGTNLTDVGKI